MMLFPVSIAVVAAAIYFSMQQEYSWAVSVHDYFEVFMSKWTPPTILVTHNTTTQEDWNMLYHLGGNGPWIPKLDGPFGDDLSVPEGCKIEQVHMVGATQHIFPSCPSCSF